MKPNKHSRKAGSAPASGAPTPGTEAQATSPSTAPVAAPKITKQVLVVLKGDAKFRGARAAWYETLKQHDGKTVDEFVAACKLTPPALPKSGVAENPNGWVGYFKRQGVVELKPQG